MQRSTENFQLLRTIMLIYFLFLFLFCIEPLLLRIMIKSILSLANEPMPPETIFYFIQAFPLLTRGILALTALDIRKEVLSVAERASGPSREVIIALGGFSFAGVIGVTVLESATRRQELELPVFYLLISFLCYLVALNLQSYKFFVSRDILSDTLTDTASLSLISSVVSVVMLAGYSSRFKALILVIALIAWLSDHFVRLVNVFGDYEKIRKRMLERKAKKNEPNRYTC